MIGDRIIATQRWWGSDYQIGWTGTLLDNTDCPKVRFDNGIVTFIRNIRYKLIEEENKVFKKSNINGAMLFKLRMGTLVTLMWREDTKSKVFFANSDILDNRVAGQISLLNIDEDLKCINNISKEYDIVAIKQFGSQAEVVHSVMNGIEPSCWDWKEKSIKEMTVEEISKALGYEVKIVKG